MTTVVAVGALIGVAACAAGWWRTRLRLRALEARLWRLEHAVHDDVLPALERTQRVGEAAADAAREARHAVGLEDPPPRLAAEAVTGPVVRAVALGAGARRALARLAADVAPMSTARRRTRRVVAATRARGGRAGADRSRARRAG